MDGQILTVQACVYIWPTIRMKGLSRLSGDTVLLVLSFAPTLCLAPLTSCMLCLID